MRGERKKEIREFDFYCPVNHGGYIRARERETEREREREREMCFNCNMYFYSIVQCTHNRYIIGCFNMMSSKVASLPFSFPLRQTLSEQFNET